MRKVKAFRNACFQYPASIFAALVFFQCIAVAEMQWETTEAKFDSAQPEMSVAYEFRCRNAAGRAVKIVTLKPSCPACTTAKADRTTLAPGESAVVNVTMDRRGRGSGQVESVLVKTDDGQETRLTMRVLSDELLSIRPAFVWWKHGEARTPKELLVEVKDPKAGVKTLTVTASTGSFDTEVVTETAGTRYRIRLTPKDTEHAGVTTFKIQADAPAAHPATVPGYAKIL